MRYISMFVTTCVVLILNCAFGANVQAAMNYDVYAVSSAAATHTNRPGGAAFYSNADHGAPVAIPNGGVNGFVFDGDGLFKVAEDKSAAHLTGTLVSLGDPTSKWLIDMWVINGRDRDDYKAGGGMPNKQLKSKHYKANGGPITTKNWWFFDMDPTRATLTGAPGTPDAGVVLSLFEIPADGSMVMQFGAGANGKNLNLGFSQWLGYSGLYNSEHADLNVDLRFDGTSVIPTPTALPLGLAMLGWVTLRRRKPCG